MTFHIDNWLDGLLALRTRLLETRGYYEPTPGTRVPLATATEAVTIATIFHQPIQDHGTLQLVQRWLAVLTDLEHDVTDAPDEVYADNRAFWSTLEAVAVYLDSEDVPPADDGVWLAALDYLGLRNAGPSGDGPIAHFDNIQSYDDLYLAQYRYLCDKRGSDTLAPPSGFTGSTEPIPRTLNSDVLQLAAYWTNALLTTKHEMGFAGTLKRWDSTLEDVARYAQGGGPTDVYPKNNEFWRNLQRVAIQVAVSDEAPSAWDFVVDSVEDSIKQLPETLSKAAHGAGDTVAGAAKVVGKELLDRLGTPLLIGAGMLGLILLARRREAS
jgi:hypothetical protein